MKKISALLLAFLMIALCGACQESKDTLYRSLHKNTDQFVTYFDFYQDADIKSPVISADNDFTLTIGQSECAFAYRPAQNLMLRVDVLKNVEGSLIERLYAHHLMQGTMMPEEMQELKLCNPVNYVTLEITNTADQRSIVLSYMDFDDSSAAINFLKKSKAFSVNTYVIDNVFVMDSVNTLDSDIQEVNSMLSDFHSKISAYLAGSHQN